MSALFDISIDLQTLDFLDKVMFQWLSSVHTRDSNSDAIRHSFSLYAISILSSVIFTKQYYTNYSYLERSICMTLDLHQHLWKYFQIIISIILPIGKYFQCHFNKSIQAKKPDIIRRVVTQATVPVWFASHTVRKNSAVVLVLVEFWFLLKKIFWLSCFRACSLSGWGGPAKMEAG